MKQFINFRTTLFLTLLVTTASLVHAQEIPSFLKDPAYRGSRVNEKKNVYDGNRIAISFFNYGLLAGSGEIRGNWPKGSRDFYIGDVLPIISAEVPIDTDGDAIPDTTVFKAVTCRGPRIGPNTKPGDPSVFWGFEAMRGFANEDGVNESPAISTDPNTWPSSWPDHPDWVDTNGQAEWNGFFGRGNFNADLEAYYWMDDQADEELFTNFGFLPDADDPTRKGLGLAVKVRGMQWSQFLAQDALFVIYEVTNTSTTTYPRVAAGLTVGTLSGGDGDSQDDLAFFDQLNNIVYSWDFDDSGNEGQDVGYVGYAFMESPGIDFDGIDNDGDSDESNLEGIPFTPPSLRGTENVFDATDFQPRTINEGDPLVLIDQKTNERSIVYVPAGGIDVISQGKSYSIKPGDVLEEPSVTIRGQLEDVTLTEKNLIDDDLDGLIDEDVSLHGANRRKETILPNGNRDIVFLPAVRYKNWVGLGTLMKTATPTYADSVNFGFYNLMIDEASADGLDNDGDWNSLSDDVGRDGAGGTGDEGEGDGKPTPGEPNFDALDIDETDQVGLSSFYYFTPPGALQMNNDRRLWDSMTPGFFTTNQELDQQQQGGGIDGDFIFSSGYFRLEPGQTQRFSLALVFGEDLPTITNNVITIQEIYNRNYNFARPPDKPTLHAVPGDGQVTLYWDALAEDSTDPILGKDFEGYKIYKSTDPYFRDPKSISDDSGNDALLAPYAQYDLDNNIQGLWYGNQDLYQRVRGVPFDLGEDNGLVHSFVDKEVQNGRRYYYALTAYDKGSEEFFPAENNFAVTIREDGTIKTDRNVVEVIPNAPVSGYVPGGLTGDITHQMGPATGDVLVEVLDPSLVKENETYSVTFEGDNGIASTYAVVNSSGQTMVDNVPITQADSYVFDGVRMKFLNDATQINFNDSGWASDGDILPPIQYLVANINSWRLTGRAVPYDYEIKFTPGTNSGQSITQKLGSLGPTVQGKATQFSVFNVTENRDAAFVFLEAVAGKENGALDANNELIFIYEEVNGTLVPTFVVRPEAFATITQWPRAGDIFQVKTFKPFSPTDEFQFSTNGSEINDGDILAQLEKIKVVPNPYVAAAAWEAPLPPTITSGRGERRVDFIHVPQNAKIRIFNVRGELVRELQQDGNITDGTVSWDLRTREDLEVAYGVYFYHVEVEGVGEKTGKLALIK